ncbi:uncharacterized protein LOC133288807 [Gastrolobium bilobum]|uniref:uncharacterized protein LOC133288807 n=1 Tax=Gastrolobium bilobum TaxID=150636 RepID=UPI002AB05ED8|nr:uncharacterized protein LOC133288807 [Gastrolobium bilobum]
MEFDEAVVHIIPRIYSDHHPILVSLFKDTSEWEERPFRLFPPWLEHPKFKNVISEYWRNETDTATNLIDLIPTLRDWNTRTFGIISRKKSSILRRLSGIQRSIDRRHNPFLEKLEFDLRTELDKTLDLEEQLWYQKDRVSWIRDGDRNTKFYHTTSVARKRRNKILPLKNSMGVWIRNDNALKSLVTNYYHQLLLEDQSARGWYTTLVNWPPLEDTEKQSPSRHISDVEIKAAEMKMGPHKAHGPDRFHAAFYQKNWDFLQNKVCKDIRGYFEKPEDITRINDTLLIIVPKVDKPERVEQLRPIALCNVLYKIITKTIVNRLKPFMNKLISPFQTSFVPGRVIHDNVIVAQEMTHTMNRMTGKKAIMSIKIDLVKAYDKLSWTFVNKVLTEVGIPSYLVHIIGSCISSSRFQVLWNGSASDHFNPSRGIRQGDPILPYIFVLCMDKLSHLITEAVSSKAWKPMKDAITQASGFKVADSLGKYLGSMLYHGRGRKRNYNSVIDRVKARLSSWKGHMLSFAGRVTLANSDTWTQLDRPLMEVAPQLLNICNSDATVEDFCVPSGNWDFESLLRQLPQDLIQHIRATLPPSVDRGPDRLVWNYNVNNRSVVKDAYSNIMKFNSLDLDPIWKTIWSWQGPQRLRSFMWLIYHGRILTNDYNAKWGGSPFCHACNIIPENITHVQRDSKLALPIWNAWIAGNIPRDFLSLPLKDWTRKNLLKGWNHPQAYDWHDILFSTVWFLWLWRNNDTHDPFFSRPHDPLILISDYIGDVMLSRPSGSREAIAAPPPQQTRWCALAMGWWKLNVDAAVKTASSSAACGGLIRNNSGNWISGFMYKIGICSPMIAELWAIYKGLQMAWDMKATMLEVESDCLTAVQAINKPNVAYSTHNPVTCINRMCNRSWHMVFTHVKRDGNNCVDWLAKKALYLDVNLVVLPVAPSELDPLLDCAPLSL